MSSTSNSVVSSGNDGALRIWDLATGRQIATYEGSDPLTCCAVSADGSMIAVGTQSGKLLVFGASPTQLVEQVPAIASSYTQGRDGQSVVAIVNHLTKNKLSILVSIVRSPGARVSAHYGISEDGRVQQYVQDADTAWGTGSLLKPDLEAVPWLGELPPGINPNQVTLQIQWEGRHGKLQVQNGTAQEQGSPASDENISFWQPTEAQYRSGLELIRQLCGRHVIPADRAHVILHSDIHKYNSDCPGPGFPLSRLISDLRASQYSQADIDDGQINSAGVTTTVEGAPTISNQEFDDWLRRRGSPALNETSSREYYSAIVERGINPAVALAIFEVTSDCDTSSRWVAVDAHNWGCLRVQSRNKRGRSTTSFRTYESWMHGLQDWCATMLKRPYKGQPLEKITRDYLPPKVDLERMFRLLRRWSNQAPTKQPTQQPGGLILIDSAKRWAKGVVPYVIDPKLSKPEVVMKAIEFWHERTPIRFVERDVDQHIDYVNFLYAHGCGAARVGRQGGKQAILVDYTCTPKDLMRGIGHTLGLLDPLRRSDRDEYVDILWENIPTTMIHNFDKNTRDAANIGSYDYDSIMHLPTTAFTLNGKPTIRTKTGQPIGQRTHLSNGDIAALQALYPDLPWKETVYAQA